MIRVQAVEQMRLDLVMVQDRILRSGQVDVSAYTEGCRAARGRELACNCPYRPGTLQFQSWLEGYYDTEK